MNLESFIQTPDPHRFLDITWDVIIVGAGPSGLIAAWYLANRGYRILVLDKAAFPREKVCGDGLNHDAVRFLNKMGLFQFIRPYCYAAPKTVLYSSKGCMIDINGPFYTIPRITFDHILAEKAASAGAVFANITVIGFNNNAKGQYAIVGKNTNRPLKSRFIILATGAKTGLVKKLGISTNHFPSAMAARFYVRSSINIATLIASFHPDVLPGYGWIFPLGNCHYNIGVISYYRKRCLTGPSPKSRLKSFCSHFKPAQRLISRGEPISRIRAAPLFSGLPRSIFPGKGNILMTGESIATTYPFTGEGLGKAMETGLTAAKIIESSAKNNRKQMHQEFQKELDKKFRPKYKGFFSAEKIMGNSWRNDLIIRVTSHSRFLKSVLHDAVVNDRGLWVSFYRNIFIH